MGIFCNHSHHSKAQKNVQDGQRTTVVSALVNGLLSIIKICGGFVTGSQGLVADGFHSLSDLTSDIIAYVTFTMARAEPDSEHPYGHQKFESLGLLILATLLGAVSIGIILQSVEHWLSGTIPQLGPVAAALAIISILANEGLFWYSYIVGKRLKSSVLVANAWHHRADAISSVVVLIGIGLNWLGFTYFDIIAAVIVGVLLLRMAVNMGKTACAELVDTAVAPEISDKIKAVILSTPGVRGSHFLRAKQTAGQLILDVHVEVAPTISVSEGHAISDEIERRLHKSFDNISDIIVHIDPYSDEEFCLIEQPDRPALEAQVASVLKEILPNAAIEKLVLHPLPKQLVAELILTNCTNEELKMAAKPLKQALEQETGPFGRLHVYLSA